MVNANLPLWSPAELERVQKSNLEMFANDRQQKLELRRLEQLSNFESIVVTEETRQRLIEDKFPFPTRWLHNKYDVNVDPSSFNLQRSFRRIDGDFFEDPAAAPNSGNLLRDPIEVRKDHLAKN